MRDVEELSTGAIYCQILDLIYDGLLPLHKVSWTADKTSDFICNFEVLDQCFKKWHIERDLNVRWSNEVERLVAGDKSELLALLEWMRFFSLSNRNLGVNYDAVGRRDGKELNKSFVEKLKLKNQESDGVLMQTNKENMGGRGGVSLDQKTLMKLAKYDLMKSERDFYYAKLRDIDQILDTFKDSNVDSIIQTIRDVIYLPQDTLGGLATNGSNFDFKSEGKEGSRFEDNLNLNTNFIDDENNESEHVGGFKFDSNTNLLDNRMDLEN